MEPVPITYVVAAVVGGVLGAALDLVLGWPWWVVAVGFVGVVWVFFLASALWGPDPIRGDHVRDVIDPQGLEEREFDRLEKSILTGQLVGFGVVGWTGSRSLGGWGGSSYPEQVTLRHGDPERDNTWVSVTTRCGRLAIGGSDWRKDHLFEELLRAEEDSPEDLDAGAKHRWLIEQRHRIQATAGEDWSPAVLTVAGATIDCDVLHRADRWVAVAVVDGVVVEIIAHGVGFVATALSRVSSLRPYIEGTRERNAEHR